MTANQLRAARIWEEFNAERLRYVDMLEFCAVVMAEIADKSECTDAEIAEATQKIVSQFRKMSPRVVANN